MKLKWKILYKKKGVQSSCGKNSVGKKILIPKAKNDLQDAIFNGIYSVEITFQKNSAYFYSRQFARIRFHFNGK